jgi:hypothetical protein
MEEEDIRVNWRAAIVPEDSTPPIYGRLSKLGRKRMEVRTDHNLMPGYRCNLALMLPKYRADEPVQYVEARCVVAISMLSAVSSQFHLTLDVTEMRGDGDMLLEDRIKKYKEVWQRS